MKEPIHVCKVCRCQCDVETRDTMNVSKCCQVKVDTFSDDAYADGHFRPAKDNPNLAL